MKKIFLGLLMLGMLLPSAVALAGYVNGYYRSNGTYVNGYYRSTPDGNPYNNYSFPGNTNPYTGKVAPGNASTYLNNYYNPSTYTSPSYNTYTTPSYLLPSYTPTTPSYTSTYSSSYEKIRGGYKSYGMVFCDSGYYEDDDGCIKAPKNSTAYGGTSFYCDSGYEKKGQKCEISVKDSTYKNGTWTCNTGLYLNKDETKCISPEQSCQEKNGEGSHHVNGTCYLCTGNMILNPSDLKCYAPENSSIKANGCPKTGKGYSVYTGVKCI